MVLQILFFISGLKNLLVSILLLHGRSEYWNTTRPVNRHSLKHFLARAHAIYLLLQDYTSWPAFNERFYVSCHVSFYNFSVQACYTHSQYDLYSYLRSSIIYIRSLPGFYWSFILLISLNLFLYFDYGLQL